MSAAPGNDPFIITVGAVDQHQTSDPSDDTITRGRRSATRPTGSRSPTSWLPVATWSCRSRGGHDPHRCAGPRGRPGPHVDVRHLVRGPGRRRARRPRSWPGHHDWTPDEVKGALMLTATYTAETGGSGRRRRDRRRRRRSPRPRPNPNENLYAFVTRDPATNAPSFDGARWATTVAANPACSTANWSGANWSGANWSGANWSGANWSGATWSENAWSAGYWDSDVSAGELQRRRDRQRRRGHRVAPAAPLP